MKTADTPLMTQYKEIKSRYMDSVLFFRLGDFYEMFFDDAVIASKELGLTLTSRNKEKNQEVPLAGVPFHSSNGYIAKLINKGYKVAICEQIEDPKTAVGIVKRDVVRVITPGTVIDTEYLDEKSNNYLLGIKINDDMAAISYIDITTGEFSTSEFKMLSLYSEINKISPKEIVLDKNTYDLINKGLKEQSLTRNILITIVDWVKKPEEYLKEFFKVGTLEGFNLYGKSNCIDISATVLKYVIELQKGNPLPVKKINYISSKEIVELNVTTQKNLDIFENVRENSTFGTLFWVLDQCKSSMGSRLLKNYIKNPLKNMMVLEERYKDVGFFIKEALLREEVRAALKDVYDIERILGKLYMENDNAKDISALKKSIKQVLDLGNLTGNNKFLTVPSEVLKRVYSIIDQAIVDEPPFSVREGGMIKSGYNSDLDELHIISTQGKDYILAIENREREKTGIKNLKIKYNKIFGYFIEITNSNKELVPYYYTRKQTLSNAERYIIPELKEYEEKVLHAKERIESLEYELFKEVSKEIKSFGNYLQKMAEEIAYIDVISTFSECALKNRYIKPEITDGYELEIRGGRHPVVEKLIKKEEFVKNDLFLDKEKNLLILTGPNMSGKSTYMKQVALIILMAHIGCYVPADYAKISIVDKVFTRIGASDDLVSGQSTFMLEMSEMAGILNSATEQSFIILDEIGRGTSTFDGISIATSISEYIHNVIGAKTIFATHYHELTQLENELSRACNYRIEVKEEKDEITFLRKIVCGGADKSYGIEVARVAGLPKEVLERSRKILKILEEQREIVNKKMSGEQLNLFGTLFSEEESLDKEEMKIHCIQEPVDQDLLKVEKIVVEKLKNLDVNNLTPVDAFLKLNELKNILG